MSEKTDASLESGCERLRRAELLEFYKIHLDSVHKFWTYFHVVGLALVVLAWSEDVPACSQSDLVYLVALFFVGYGFSNAIIILSIQRKLHAIGIAMDASLGKSDVTKEAHAGTGPTIQAPSVMAAMSPALVLVSQGVLIVVGFIAILLKCDSG